MKPHKADSTKYLWYQLYISMPTSDKAQTLIKNMSINSEAWLNRLKTSKMESVGIKNGGPGNQKIKTKPGLKSYKGKQTDEWVTDWHIKVQFKQEPWYFGM